LIRAQSVDRERYPGRPAPSLAKVAWLEKQLPPWWNEKGPVMKNGKNGNGHGDLAQKARPFLAQLEELDAELDTERQVYGARRREIEGRRKQVFAAAEEAGLEPASLRAVHEFRKADRKIRARLEPRQVAEYEKLAAAFKGLPFGKHCAEIAQAARCAAVRAANGAAHHGA
jgi:hypothetical protein